eukprot:jgi/Tetstr1/460579/TSEL_000504.t1
MSTRGAFTQLRPQAAARPASALSSCPARRSAPLPARTSRPAGQPLRRRSLHLVAMAKGSPGNEPGPLETLMGILMGKPKEKAAPEPAKPAAPKPTPAPAAKATPEPAKAAATPEKPKPEPSKADGFKQEDKTFQFEDVESTEPKKAEEAPAPSRPSAIKAEPAKAEPAKAEAPKPEPVAEAAPTPAPKEEEPAPTPAPKEEPVPAPAAANKAEPAPATPKEEAKVAASKAPEPEPEPKGMDVEDFQKEVAKRNAKASTHEAKYLQTRLEAVRDYFPGSLPADDLLFRLEVALQQFGFDGSNSIGIVNLCRDEATNMLKQKIEAIYPLVFNINGLGGGLTCGVTGMGAGLSHSPVSGGRKRYIFFSAPHVAIDSKGDAGPLARPGQQVTNCACGAMIGALGQFNANGLKTYMTPDGKHEAADPEFSIFKQRLAGRIQKEKKELKDIDLVELTKICERQISSDLEFLISKAVDTKDADYAVITGVQIHNWGEKYDNGEPNFEMVAPTGSYVVVNGVKTELDLASMLPPTPRQLSLLTDQAPRTTTASVSASAVDATMTDINGQGMFASDAAKKAAARNQRERTFLTFLVEKGDL